MNRKYVTVQRRVTALCNQSLTFEVDADVWANLKRMEYSVDDALAEIKEDEKNYRIIENTVELDEVVMVHGETVEE